MYSIQHYVIKLVSDLRQVGGFHRVHQSCWHIVESGIKHNNPSPNTYITLSSLWKIKHKNMKTPFLDYKKSNKKVDIVFSARDGFLKWPSSSTIKVKRFESKINNFVYEYVT
jgi:hypothetical protein